MNECKHYTKLADGVVNMYVPPRVEGMLAGATVAKQDSTGTITLVYEDRTEESRACNKDLIREFDGFFSIVSFVQDGRKA